MDNGNGKFYTIEELMQLANTGACIITPDQEVPITKKVQGTQICADKVEGAMFNPDALKGLACRKLRFQVQNQSAQARWLGFGAGFYSPGLDPLYPGSEFNGARGVDSANFFVGAAGIPLASGPNALAVQSFLRRCPRTLAKSFSLLNIAQTDPIFNQPVHTERWSCLQAKCEGDVFAPVCGECANNSSTVQTFRWNFGLRAIDERNAFGILIPAAPEVPANATIYNVELELAFVEGMYGYVYPNC